jgi:hypothetical protein
MMSFNSCRDKFEVVENAGRCWSGVRDEEDPKKFTDGEVSLCREMVWFASRLPAAMASTVCRQRMVNC